jgi:diguanylate cyclase (GGDEF)-like protein/PAS domain S-box-containing protein
LHPKSAIAGRLVIEQLDQILPAILAFATVLYLWLAVRVSRASAELSSNTVSYFLFLIGMMTAGSAFAYNATDPHIYGIGRTLTFFSAGFLPVALYSIYREFTASKPHVLVIAVLSIIPIASTGLAMTNELHHLIWSIVELDGEIRFTEPDEHIWFKRIHAPFAYGLFGFSIIAMAGRLPTIARAHRRKMIMLLICAILPFAVSMANTVFKIGPIDFPFTSLTLVLLLPLYWYASMALRVYEFSPLAYQTMFDHVRDPIIVLDKSQRIISANNPAQALLESSESQLIGQKLWEDVPEARAILDHGKNRDLTQTVRMKSDRYFELNSAPLTGPSGQNQGTVVVCRDVTERKQALRALADSEHLIRSLVEHSSNGILRFARDSQDEGTRFRCIFSNRAAERFLQAGTGTLVGMPLDKLEILSPERLLEQFGGESPPMTSTSYETVVEIDDDEVWLRVVGEPVGNDFSVTLIDITQRKRNETKILADALRDPLTGILNRRGFEEQAGEAIARSDQGAVLYLDLNHFKTINDRFGHQAGDALLKAFGHRLEFCLRPEDILARLGGDEFAIVLPGISVEDAKHVARRLVDTAFEAYIIQGQEIECAASVGIALMPQHGEALWDLVSIADQAMYNAKQISKEDAANDRAAYVEAAIAS